MENLKKGEEGEERWESFLNTLSNDVLILYDLTLEHNYTTFQIDALCIFQQTIMAFEVKNYEGDFQIKDDLWFNSSGNEIKNPLLQVKRSESLLRQLCKQFNNHLTIEFHLLFIHPDFMLYQAPSDQPIIFQQQINRFIYQINNTTSSLNKKHHELANQLVTLDRNSTGYERKISYKYAELQKGIWCRNCAGQHINRKKILHCVQCESREDFNNCVLRHVNELKTLFPDYRITTRLVYDWCGGVVSKCTIQRVLCRNFKKIGGSKNIYYVIS
ncbi:nuclease-related domain-containing protein [Cytobacillus purgationiresistens]|uniref:NERD domain-containing protein n=1 Tax=Cytobacillus purgationiresistens TaxID=863449 RepID=A0ABU0ARB9_9BACI|nr:nuclease-related domain-containing protein [Cytobacillus purgationiresistens]MDQ0273306.1 hypothetical protein [Cytobacillus purgationiresistens]